MLTWNEAYRSADRWACRLALILEAFAIAWTGGEELASRASAEADRLLAVLAVTAASAVVAFAVHGRSLLGVGARDTES